MKLTDFCSRGDAVSGLIRDLKEGRMPNALLITGEEGIGKKSLAMLLARALLCTAENTAEHPCDECRNCKKTLKGSHPDLMFLMPADEKKKSIGIEDIRLRLKALSTHAFSGGKRVLLYDGSYSLTEPAQNALLKSLEESDLSQYFILVANEESEVLPTVRSRCRILRMQPMSEKEISNILLSLEAADPEKIRLAVSDCGGSIGKAKKILQDQNHWELRTLCDRTLFSVSSVRDILPAAALLIDRKDDAAELIALAEERIHRLIVKKTENLENEDRDMPPKWNNLSIDTLSDIAQILMQAHQRLNRNVGWQALIENILYSIIEEVRND